MTRATSRATSARVVLPGQGTASASQPVSPQHAGTQPATGGDERLIRKGSGVDLCVRLERIAELYAALAAEYRQIADDIQLAVTDGRALMGGMASRRLFSVRNLADFLDVDEKTVRRWREQGRLPEAVEIGGVVRWRPEDIGAWLEKQRG